MRAKSARQTFPRWHVEHAAEAPPPRRGATVIAFPEPAARERRVLTYPQALVMPDRRDNAQPPPLRRIRLAMAAAGLAGLAAILLA